MKNSYSRAWNCSGYPYGYRLRTAGLARDGSGCRNGAGTVQEVVFGWLLIILAAMPLIQTYKPESLNHNL
ncbi:hypothetical protein [Methanosarcina sp. DH2]|uniref:hypothetical protein n=1 Tax=Methanosarcina sp. DH2 TaxID=2605639 RepID=UPI001E3266A1|nr:hypothetical protein [Methanosarcina sp. DH2]